MWRDQTIKMYDPFDGFLTNSVLLCIVWVGSIMIPVFSSSPFCKTFSWSFSAKPPWSRPVRSCRFCFLYTSHATVPIDDAAVGPNVSHAIQHLGEVGPGFLEVAKSAAERSTIRWWSHRVFMVTPVTPIWGRFPIWRAHFSNGLVQPPTRQVLNPDFLYHLDLEINSEVNLQSCVQSTVEVPSKEILETIYLDGIEQGLHSHLGMNLIYIDEESCLPFSYLLHRSPVERFPFSEAFGQPQQVEVTVIQTTTDNPNLCRWQHDKMGMIDDAKPFRFGDVGDDSWHRIRGAFPTSINQYPSGFFVSGLAMKISTREETLLFGPFFPTFQLWKRVCS